MFIHTQDKNTHTLIAAVQTEHNMLRLGLLGLFACKVE